MGLSTGHRFFGVAGLTVGDSLSRTFSVLEGVPFQILLDLSLTVATSGQYGNDIGITGDFGNTGKMFLSATEPGVTITSASGHSYAPPTTPAVPEPGTLALLVSVLGPAIFTIRRKSHSK